MKKAHTKEAAEAILRELPSVRGAFVREDVYGHPREVHVLVGPGPEPRLLARDIRELLEERLGVPVDQRVISIAQLSDRVDRIPIEEVVGQGTSAGPATGAGHDVGDEPAPIAWPGTDAGGATDAAPTASAHYAAAMGPGSPGAHPARRLIFQGLESLVRGGKIVAKIRVAWKGNTFEGTAEDIDGGAGRIRAVAAATLRAASEACSGKMHLELESASVVHALGNDYVLVSAHAISPLLGRRPVPLAGAHPSTAGEEAAALAALQATNRVLTLALGD